jgi:hypothetical protein
MSCLFVLCAVVFAGLLAFALVILCDGDGFCRLTRTVGFTPAAIAALTAEAEISG